MKLADMTMDQIRDLLVVVANDFDQTGCEGLGTVSVETMNEVRVALGWEPEPLVETEEDPT